SLDGAIRIYSTQATAPGYSLENVGHSHDFSITGPIFLPEAAHTEVSPSAGAIEFTIPSEESLYDKSLPIHYSATLSRPMPVGDGKHFTWAGTTVEGTTTISLGTRGQARALEIYEAVVVSISAALALGVISWPVRRLHRFRRSCKERGLNW